MQSNQSPTRRHHFLLSTLTLQTMHKCRWICIQVHFKPNVNVQISQKVKAAKQVVWHARQRGWPMSPIMRNCHCIGARESWWRETKNQRKHATRSSFARWLPTSCMISFQNIFKTIISGVRWIPFSFSYCFHESESSDLYNEYSMVLWKPRWRPG